MKVLIIIPAFNEAGNLPELLQRIKSSQNNYDILVINDCSWDNTRDICNKHHVKVANLPVNLGIGGAVQTGYIYALYNGYDIAVQVDGDGQHNPKYIGELIKAIKNGANMCVGSRFIDKKGFQSTFLRRIGIDYFSTLIHIFTGTTITDPTSGFRACDRKVIALFANAYPRDYPEPESIVTVTKSGLLVKEVAVVMKKRNAGISSITSLKSMYYMIKVTLAIIFAALKNKSR